VTFEHFFGIAIYLGTFTMLSSLLSLLLLLFSFSPATAFVHHSPASPRAFVLLESKTTKISQLAMSTETSTLPEIEVVSQPDKGFLEKKGVCESSQTFVFPHH
jgi:hypothetical protein